MDLILALGKWIKDDPSYLILTFVIVWMFKILKEKDIYINSLVKTLGKNTESLITLTALIEVLVHRGGGHDN